jgi:hypothetical protein
MKIKLFLVVTVALCALQTVLSTAQAQGTAFSYQGSLSANAAPANGFFDFEFSLYTNGTRTGTQVGTTLTQTNLGVTNGLFNTDLNFGDVFSGDATWLAISVRTNGGSSFTALNPLQELTPTPYAIYAPNAGAAASADTVAATNITGALALAQLPGAVVTNDEGSVILSNVTVNGNLNLSSPATIDSGGNSLLLSFGNNNFYAGPGAGNLTNTGSANTGIGSQSLQVNTNGTNNTAIGYLTLGGNTSGSYNTATGERALADNTGGNDNTADGRHALLNNTKGNDNTASGYDALSANTSGSQNTAVGSSALSGNPGGSNNIALGYQAGSTFGNNESSNIDIGNLGVARDNNTIRIGQSQTETYIAGVLNGDGGGLTNLNAAQLAGGTIPLEQLPSAVVTNNEPNATLGKLTLGGSLSLSSPATIEIGSSSLLYADNKGNFFAGLNAGNLATSGTYNTAVGSGSLLFNTTGIENAAFGPSTLLENNSGSYNSALGQFALQNNISGSNNTAIGFSALYSNTNGNQNVALGGSALGNCKNDNEAVAVGYQALQNDNAFNNGVTTDGNGHNTALGYQALQKDTGGFGNTATGYQALLQNISGYYNTATGDKALYLNTSGFGNTANGEDALYYNTSGSQNTAYGEYALLYNTNDNQLVAIGYDALANDNAYNGIPGSDSGSNTLSGNGENTAIGYYALNANNIGAANTAVGYDALINNTAGACNTAIGNRALDGIETGSNNIAIGFYAGSEIGNGTYNIDIGNPGEADDDFVIRIGGTAGPVTTYITGIYENTYFAGSPTLPVVIDQYGQLGTSGSSERFKQNIRSMDDASAELLSLRPVTFQYKPEMDPHGTAQFGLVAEEVEKVDPDLIVRDSKGEVFTVRYDAVNAMLLNEFLKQHKKVEEQSTEIETLKEKAGKVDSLEARLSELEATVKALAGRK